MPSKLPKSSSPKKIRNIKLTLEYDGSRFCGFQLQTGRPTIQAALETALSRLFDRPMKISAAAGRTDAGVHALGQVVNFKTASSIPVFKIQRGLNVYLPPEIAVKKAEEVPLSFHARFQAKWKIYEYRVLASKVRSPLLNGRAYQCPFPLDVSRIKRAAKRVLGRRNFKSFQASGSPIRDCVRHVRRAAVSQEGDILCFAFEADGFLYHMVRNLVGALLEVGKGKLSVENLGRILKSGNRRLAPATAPACGLTLVDVTY